MHLLTALIGLSTVAAQISRVCPTSDSKLCYSLNIPSVTAQSGNGDIFLQIQAPANTYQWIALGQGSNMRGSHFMILYLSSDGKNVTVSPRVGTGHVQPQNDASTTQSSGISVLEGSSISNGLITANFRCSGCTSWSGGSMDFTSGSGGWNFAYKAGTPIQSNDLNAGIQRHDDHGEFNWDFSAAKGTTASANPFVTSSTLTTGSNTGSGNNTTTTTTQVGTTVTSGSTSNSIIIAHAVFACLTVALVLPIGGIIIRLMSFPGLLWVHSAIQLLGTAMFITAFGLGAYYATKNDYWMSSHAIIGTVVLALMLCQPILGVIHHKMYVREQRRGAFSYAHIGIGRIVVFLGIINGGLGLELAGQSVGAKAGYGAGAGLMGLIYLAAIIIGERKRSRTKLSSDASSSRSDIARAEQQQYHVTK